MLKRTVIALVLLISVLMLFSCKKTDNAQTDIKNNSSELKQSETVGDKEQNTEKVLADGVYNVEFVTDSSMFKLNETCGGIATLTVEGESMILHITLRSKNIVNLFLGRAEDAKKDGAVLIEPTVDVVTYDDGESEEVYGYDVPVTVIGEEFDLAVIGTKGKWYDHRVSVQNPVLCTDSENTKISLEKGTFEIEVTLEGGTGKASIASPTELYAENGEVYVKIVWSSPNYDYMLVDGAKFEPEIIDGHSVFMIPVEDIYSALTVIADTTAMSTPHEIEYTITFDVSSIKKIDD